MPIPADWRIKETVNEDWVEKYCDGRHGGRDQEAALQADVIASNLKDAVVAAVINKSRFKLKMVDTKDAKGKIVETILQAEYERPGMSPVRIWVLNNRGEVGALAVVLRKAVANSLPELAAA